MPEDCNEEVTLTSTGANFLLFLLVGASSCFMTPGIAEVSQMLQAGMIL
jgi:hypothetical protein